MARREASDAEALDVQLEVRELGFALCTKIVNVNRLPVDDGRPTAEPRVIGRCFSTRERGMAP